MKLIKKLWVSRVERWYDESYTFITADKNEVNTYIGYYNTRDGKAFEYTKDNLQEVTSKRALAIMKHLVGGHDDC